MFIICYIKDILDYVKVKYCMFYFDFYNISLEMECDVVILYWDFGLDYDMVDFIIFIFWSDQYFGNGDGEVMSGFF